MQEFCIEAALFLIGAKGLIEIIHKTPEVN